MVFSTDRRRAPTRPTGTSLDLSPLQALAGNPAQLVDALNVLLLHGTMSAEMRDSIIDAVSAVSADQSAEARTNRRLSRRHVVAVSGGEIAMNVTRREFLLQTGHACVGYALGAAAFAAGVQRFSLINALAQGSDYRALVCVFLAGGNDGNNMVVPATTTEYNAYAAVRERVGPGDSARHAAADHAAEHRQPVRPASEPGGAARAVGRAEAVGRLQRRPARAAADAGAVPGGAPRPVPAVLALRSGRAVADGDRRPRRSDRLGRTHRRPLRAASARGSR